VRSDSSPRVRAAVEIFHHLPNGQLAIFPNATHAIPFDDPALFNATVVRFLRTPFVKRDRIKDLMQSLEKVRTYYSANPFAGSTTFTRWAT
jgi:hypothetical protein